jgi:hypothetical protein
MPEWKALTTAVGTPSLTNNMVNTNKEDVNYIQVLLYLIPGIAKTRTEMDLLDPHNTLDGFELGPFIERFQDAHKIETDGEPRGRVEPWPGKTLRALQKEADAADKAIKDGVAQGRVLMAEQLRRQRLNTMHDFMTPEKSAPLDTSWLTNTLLKIIAHPSKIEFVNSQSIGGGALIGTGTVGSFDFKLGSETRTYLLVAGGVSLGKAPVSLAFSTKKHPSGALGDRVFTGLLRSDPSLDDLNGPCVVYSGGEIGILLPTFGGSVSMYCLMSGLGLAVATSGGFMPPAVIPAARAFLFLAGAQSGTPEASLSIQVGALSDDKGDARPQPPVHTRRLPYRFDAKQ